MLTLALTKERRVVSDLYDMIYDPHTIQIIMDKKEEMLRI